MAKSCGSGSATLTLWCRDAGGGAEQGAGREGGGGPRGGSGLPRRGQDRGRHQHAQAGKQLETTFQNIRIRICNQQCCESRIGIYSIPDPNFFHPGSRIHIKEFKYFNPQKMVFKLSEIWLGLFIRIRILTFYPSRIPDPGIKRHRIPDPQEGYPDLSKPNDFLKKNITGRKATWLQSNTLKLKLVQRLFPCSTQNFVLLFL